MSTPNVVLLTLFSIPIVVPWCTWASGESGNGGDRMVGYCPHDTYGANVIEFKEACYARCNCWTDLPSLGGHIYKEVDAICIRDKCYCVFEEKGYCKERLPSLLLVGPYIFHTGAGLRMKSFWQSSSTP